MNYLCTIGILLLLLVSCASHRNKVGNVDEFPSRIFYQISSCDSCRTYYQIVRKAWAFDTTNAVFSYNDSGKFTLWNMDTDCRKKCFKGFTKKEIYTLFGKATDSSAFGMAYRLQPIQNHNRELIFRFIDDYRAESGDTAVSFPELFLEE